MKWYNIILNLTSTKRVYLLNLLLIRGLGSRSFRSSSLGGRILGHVIILERRGPKLSPAVGGHESLVLLLSLPEQLLVSVAKIRDGLVLIPR